jgi:plastocyanin domain-containing protein
MKSKNIFYYFGIFVLIAVAGFFLLRAEGSDGGGFGESAVLKDGFQEIILSMKDYNYYPNEVRVKSGIPVRIYLDEVVFGCLRDFTVRDFGVHKYLKTSDDYVEFTPTEKGRYAFACSMGMGTGTFVVE